MVFRKFEIFKSMWGLALASLLLVGCAGSSGVAVDAAKGASEESVYLSESVWTDAKAEKHSLKSLRGSPRVLTMVFTKCPSACPMIISDMKKVEAALGKNARERVRFTVFSFDPERDTPATLMAFGKKMSLGPKWDLFVGSDSDTRELAAILGVQYKKIPSGDFIHTNMLIAVDENGLVLAQREGLTGSLDELAQKLNSKMP